MSTRGGAGGWAVVPRPTPDPVLRLFCFPYAGGGASVFHPWARVLPPRVELVAVQPPGREGRLAEAPFADVLALVEAMEPALAPYLDRPFACFGHSNGALMAFELTRRLRRLGRPLPVHLFVAGKPAPHCPIREPHIHALPEEQFVAELRALGGTPEEILQHREIMELITPLLRADFSLGETYRYSAQPPLEVPITAFGGLLDREVSQAEMEAWGEHTSAAFRLRMFPGDHFFLNADRDALLAEIVGDLRPRLRSP